MAIPRRSFSPSALPRFALTLTLLGWVASPIRLNFTTLERLSLSDPLKDRGRCPESKKLRYPSRITRHGLLFAASNRSYPPKADILVRK